MEENTKLNNKKKAIIITIVSIIAVLVTGIGIGALTGYLMDKQNNKVKASSQSQEIVSSENNNEEKNSENIILKIDEAENEELPIDAEQELSQVEEPNLEEQEKLDEQAKLEEKQKQEDAKKKEEEKKKQETKTTVTTNVNNGYPYYIKVNYTANTVTVYKKDSNGYYTVPVRAMVCSTGAATPRSGVYKTPQKARWGMLIGPVWGQYCTRITGQILFHSVPYLKQNDPSSLEYWEYDRLGVTRSMGCIRLTVADAKWIFDNCPLGTSVEFYSSSNPGPLGKPSAQKVSSAGDPYRGWDPTDPNPNNPWRTKAAKEAEEKAAEEKAAKEAAEKKAAEKKAAEEKAAKEKAEKEAEEKRKAEEANKITVPNVVGKTEAEAKNLLKDLKVTVKYDENATKNNGLVSYQSVTSSSKVEKGTLITITVNKVKSNTNTTNNTNTSKDNNSAKETNTSKDSNSTNKTNTTKIVNATN